MHRLRNLAGLQRERGLVELRNRLAPHDRQLAALVLRARVGRVFLGEGGEVGLRLQARRRRPAELRVDRVRKRLLLHQDVRDVPRLGSRIDLRVLVVVGLDLVLADRDPRGDLLRDPLLDQLRADPLTDFLVGQPLLLQRGAVLLLAATEVLLLDLLEAALDLCVGDGDAEHLRLLLVLGATVVFALRSQRSPVTVTPIIVTKTVEVPVIHEKTVTQVVYRKRDRREVASRNANDNPMAPRQNEATLVSLSGFTPTNEVKLTIIKGSYQDEK